MLGTGSGEFTIKNSDGMYCTVYKGNGSFYKTYFSDKKFTPQEYEITKEEYLEKLEIFTKLLIEGRINV